MKFAANLSYMWSELPYYDRFEAAADAGFDAVEILYPYDAGVPDTLSALSRNGLRMVRLNAPPPNYTGGKSGFAAVPELADRFEYDMRRVLRYATAFKVTNVHVLTGVAEGADARLTLIHNLRAAAQKAPKGLKLTIGPHPNSGFLQSYDLAVEILQEVKLRNVGLLFDSAYAQIITGDACAAYAEYAPLVTHITLADGEQRKAPGTGDVDVASLLDSVAASGYRGWVVGAYSAGTRTEDSLKGWMRPR